MPSIDTNVLVRFLVKDDPRQHARARDLLCKATEDDPVFVPLTVTLELEWVLRSRYGIDKPGIVATFTQLLETAEIAFHDEASVERALSLFAESTADFADCLHVAIAMSCDRTPLVTFDRKAARLPLTLAP